MNQVIEQLKAAVSQFVSSCGREYEFPAGGQIQLLRPYETELFNVLNDSSLSDADKIRIISDGLDWSDCYSIVVFGVRLAILGTRTMKPDEYRCGVLALAAGAPKVDWRDALGALAIFENCGKRLGINFRNEIESVAQFTDEGKLRTSLDGYFSRPDEMRGVDVMGFVESGEGNGFTFRPKDMI